MRYYYDLHMHSALSPCAENEMTPNNIINMAGVNGLDIIAVTDHNSAANLPACFKCAEKKGLVFVPGIEVESVEEVHIICLFGDLDSAMRMGEAVESRLVPMENTEAIFGEQIIMDENDVETGRKDQLLIVSTDLTSDEIFDLADGLGGAVYFAHIDRDSYSVYSSLGGIPEEIDTSVVEVASLTSDFTKGLMEGELSGMFFVWSSDCHRLRDMHGREAFFDLDRDPEDIDAQYVVDWLRMKNRG